MSAASGRLHNKIAVITGAASGIGWATAQRFAEEGATVVMVDRAEQQLAERLSALCKDGGGHHKVVCDVTLEQDWVRLLKEVESMFGRLDVLVNNVGYGHLQSIADMSFAEYKFVVAVNLDSVFLGTKYALPLLARGGNGSIVNVSSVRGQVGGMHTGAYCAAKGGVRLFTKATAIECAAARNGVRANSVHPGQVETPMSVPVQAKADPSVMQKPEQRIPMGRVAQPIEIAQAIVFLAGDESSFMTGSEVTVDGGYTAQ